MKEDYSYDDIIHLQYPRPQRWARMSMIDRGAQFSPFAALTGFEAAIEETGRRTERRIELTEGEKLRLNERLQELAERLDSCPGIRLTWFRPDLRKEGGEYVTEAVRVKRFEAYGRGLILEDGRLVLFQDLLSLEEPECTM